MSSAHLIPSLEPKLRDLYTRHRERAKAIDWGYHEYLPLDELRADPQSLPTLSDVAYLAVETALFTEVNLPWFTTGLHYMFKGSLEVMQEFIYDWTSEEDQHAMLLETYLLLGDNGDHRERARLRKMIVRQGWETNIQNHLEAIAYTAMQELATRAFYQRVAAVCKSEDPLLARALNRLAKDETLHYAFYKDAVKLHLEVEPNYAEPLAKMMLTFEMPGYDMPGYTVRAGILAREGVYGPDHHFQTTVDVLWKEWDITGLAPSAAPARAAQKQLISWHEKLGRIAARYAARREGEVRSRELEEGVLAGEASFRRSGAAHKGNGVYKQVLETAPKV
ncbi:MAG TPA: acyl-ACP desaturase [Chloroflexota bacterium]|nr:acyl-ACP desaturase [Chloroflexota bacterium]